MFKPVLVFLLLAFGTFGTIYADNFERNPDTGEIPFRPKRPKPKDLSSDNTIVCYYQAGVLTITFEEPEGRGVLTVTRMEDGMSESAAFYTFFTFTYNIGTAPGTYLLEIKTSKNCYEGTLTLEY